MNRTRGRAGAVFAAAVSLAAGLLTACTPTAGGPNGPPVDGPDPHGLTVWTTDTLPDRVAKMELILDKFAVATGLSVDLVSVPAHRFNQVLTSSAASGDLPDVIGGITLADVRTVAASGFANTEANADVIRKLGEKTWSPRSLELTRDGGQQLAVPDSTWQQLLYYRKDLFAKAGQSLSRTVLQRGPRQGLIACDGRRAGSHFGDGEGPLIDEAGREGNERGVLERLLDEVGDGRVGRALRLSRSGERSRRHREVLSRVLANRRLTSTVR